MRILARVLIVVTWWVAIDVLVPLWVPVHVLRWSIAHVFRGLIVTVAWSMFPTWSVVRVVLLCTSVMGGPLVVVVVVIVIVVSMAWGMIVIVAWRIMVITPIVVVVLVPVISVLVPVVVIVVVIIVPVVIVVIVMPVVLVLRWIVFVRLPVHWWVVSSVGGFWIIGLVFAHICYSFMLRWIVLLIFVRRGFVCTVRTVFFSWMGALRVLGDWGRKCYLGGQGGDKKGGKRKRHCKNEMKKKIRRV